LSQLVLELTGSKSKVERHPLPEDDPRVRRPDIGRAKKLLGWEPKVALKDGLKETIAYFGGLERSRLGSNG
jgi:UDP-glucuronate decarboxylase